MGTTGPTDETALGGSASDTRRASPISPSGWLASPTPADGRFDSGTILGDRYRIIGLLGRGGMGPKSIALTISASVNPSR